MLLLRVHPCVFPVFFHIFFPPISLSQFRPTHPSFLLPFSFLSSPLPFSSSFTQIEQKMLESAQNLLVVCQNETKMHKLRDAVKTHQRNVEKLKQQIEELKGQHTTQV